MGIIIINLKIQINMSKNKITNFARINEGYKMGNAPLPSEMIADLTDAFQFYDKENMGYVSIPHFRNILHNFGYHKPAGGKKEIDGDLERADFEFKKEIAFNLISSKQSFNQNGIKVASRKSHANASSFSIRGIRITSPPLI